MKVEFLEDGSPDCPLIRLYGIDPGDFVMLHQEIRRLATREIMQVSVDRLPNFMGVDGCQLSMVSSPTDIGVRRWAEALRFEWQLTPKMWDIASDFTAPFAADLHVGRYQWLAGRHSSFGIDVGEIAVLISATEKGEW